jgi:hypothetical protein
MSSDAENLKTIIKILAIANIALVIFLALALKKMNDDWHDIRYLNAEIDDADRICPGFQLKAHPEMFENSVGASGDSPH